MIIWLVIAVAAVSAPVAGAVLVSLAIHREDAALSLSSRPSSLLQAAARRLLGFHGDGFRTMPGRQGGTGARQAPASPEDWINGDGAFPADGDYGTGDHGAGQLPSHKVLAGPGGRAGR
jgi:hypothetical protein